VASLAGAEELDATGKARVHFEAGRALYRLGNYAEALREFEAGYQLAPRPQFLVNIGQAYRKLGDLPRAKETFERYLAAVPDSPERPQIENLIAELAAQLAAPPPPPVEPPAEKATAPPPPEKSAEPPPEKPAPAPVLIAQPPPPKKRSFFARHWWIVPVAAAVAAGLAVGIYYAARPSTVQCGDANVILCASAR